LRESIEKKFGVKAELIKGTGGVFEVDMYNEYRDARHKLFSKKELNRFPNNNEVEELLEGWEEVK